MDETASTGAVANWAATREEVIEMVAKIIKTDFDPAEPFKDPLTGTVRTVDQLRLDFCQALYGFESAPFTVQRIAELTLEPTKHFGRKDVIKYLHALLHNVHVTSTVNDFDAEEDIDHESERGVVLSDIEWTSS
ncbi:hypothetical protein B9G98_04164 [Wickerhamiella sorbophila]|uniref:Uncharacterized protein n=1 Tax=Wickerhamiella sorbophila TaxID=45607 RepID=A0A2T0FNI6_9ASCO|nr:hypothetical protein B9G98_04164 [Wickerhamiella sorbophila]PRT56544.1 hypothetical protein B9G98_04164 [Wickerhamiella sorbophila]